MTRFRRPDFNIDEINGLGDEARTRLQFDWLRDDGDRAQWLQELGGRVEWIRSRAHVLDDPSPPRSAPVPQGHVSVALVSDPRDVETALSRPDQFSNAPYAELGGAAFMLAIEPGKDKVGNDWHAEQRKLAEDALQYAPSALEEAARRACEQAELLSLRAPSFDMAEWAEQAALRYFGLLFGFAGRDHLLLEDAARAGYRALQYLIIGRHFTSEPGTLPAAQLALARLATRSAALMDDYALLARSPRAPLHPAQEHPADTWPDGVQPWHELGLSALGHPVLKKLPGMAGRLNGQDLCNVVGGLLVGTVGNVQTALCQMVQHALAEPPELRRIKSLNIQGLQHEVTRLLALLPPVPFLPRRAIVKVTLNGATVGAGTDCILVLAPKLGASCPFAWGSVAAPAKAPHACLGRALIEPLLAVLLQRTLNLPGLAERIDGRTGERLKPERLWGMGCLRYPLQHDREQLRVQQPLIVVMRIKSPQAENAERLRRVVRSGAPRIEWALKDSRHVHMAWFEFMENDSLLVLRTIYDGDFDAYIQHFALKVGDLFDLLFESIEGAPPLPVAEHPYEFVETIRRHNRTPLGGYFFSAYPHKEVAQITGPLRGQP